jgi:hypothetical protein
MSNETTGALTGAAASALYWWTRNENDRDRRLRDLKADNRDLKERFNELLMGGDLVRMQLPIVRDAVTGIAEASAGAAVASPVPNPTTQSRPNLSSGSNIPGMQWPPLSPNYDSNGNTNQLGEMAIAFRTLTYQENRAWNQGLTLANVPTAGGLLQLFYAAQGLTGAVASLGLSIAQYQTAWTGLFAGFAPTPPTPPTTAAVVHEDPSRPPSVSPIFAGLNIVPLTNQAGGVPGYAYANRNTDSVQRYRVTAPAGGVGAGIAIGTVTFGTEYRYRDSIGNLVPFQPAIPLAMSSLNASFGATNITSTGFTIVAKEVLAGSTVHDVTLVVIPGLPTA